MQEMDVAHAGPNRGARKNAQDMSGDRGEADKVNMYYIRRAKGGI